MKNIILIVEMQNNKNVGTNKNYKLALFTYFEGD